MVFEFTDRIWYWRGPAPWYFVTVPPDHAEAIKAVSRFVTYGWGMIPAVVTAGDTQWKTALWPKEGLYIVPIKAAVLKAENLSEGSEVTLRLAIGE